MPRRTRPRRRQRPPEFGPLTGVGSSRALAEALIAQREREPGHPRYRRG